MASTPATIPAVPGANFSPFVDVEELVQAERDRQRIAAEQAAIQAAVEARLWARWGPVHQCEQPDSWSVQGRFGNGLSGGGGLGISDGAWVDAGGWEYAPVAGMATPVQQMLVAEMILARHGPGAWGCPVD